MTLRRVLARLLLPLLLVFTQQGVILHELGHAFEAIAHSDAHSPKKDVCATCVAFTNVHHLAEASAPGVLLIPEQHEQPQDVAFVSIARLLRPAYLSRAPPARS